MYILGLRIIRTHTTCIHVHVYTCTCGVHVYVCTGVFIFVQSLQPQDIVACRWDSSVSTGPWPGLLSPRLSRQ